MYYLNKTNSVIAELVDFKQLFRVRVRVREELYRQRTNNVIILSSITDVIYVDSLYTME